MTMRQQWRPQQCPQQPHLRRRPPPSHHHPSDASHRPLRLRRNPACPLGPGHRNPASPPGIHCDNPGDQMLTVGGIPGFGFVDQILSVGSGYVDLTSFAGFVNVDQIWLAGSRTAVPTWTPACSTAPRFVPVVTDCAGRPPGMSLPVVPGAVAQNAATFRTGEMTTATPTAFHPATRNCPMPPVHCGKNFHHHYGPRQIRPGHQLR